jgi:hypothetical protein
VQYLAAVAALLLAFQVGILSGTLAPLVHLDGWGQPLLVPAVAIVYLLVLAPLGLIESDPSRSVDTAGWEQVRVSGLAGAVAGALVGGGLVFGVPDWLSTTLPLVTLSAAALAFVFAGDAVPIEGLDTALLSTGGTIHLFVVPVVLSSLVGGIALVVAVPLGMVSLLGVRNWLGAHSPIDRRVSVSLAVVFALVAGGVMAHDLSGSRPATDLDTDATANLSAAENRTYSITDYGFRSLSVPIGTVSVDNAFGFERTADVPAYTACLYDTGGKRIQTTAGHGPVLVVGNDEYASPVDQVRLAGGEHHQYGVVVLLDSVEGRSLAEIRDLGTVPVRRADSCPGTTDGPALVLVPDGERGRR